MNYLFATFGVIAGDQTVEVESNFWECVLNLYLRERCTCCHLIISKLLYRWLAKNQCTKSKELFFTQVSGNVSFCAGLLSEYFVCFGDHISYFGKLFFSLVAVGLFASSDFIVGAQVLGLSVVVEWKIADAVVVVAFHNRQSHLFEFPF